MNIQRKPEWLRKKANLSDQNDMRSLLKELQLNTVCQQALCPNISDCFASGQATFLILGISCTRLCSFCNVEKGTPLPIDYGEPLRVAEAVARLKLSHVVITSPTRDDLADGGAKIYVATVTAIRSYSPTTRVELLIPDFQNDKSSLKAVVAAKPDIIAHNVETIPRLYNIRKGADYNRSLEVLRFCAELSPNIRIKSGIMLGMGELEEEVLNVCEDLHRAGCSYLSIGQYIAPSRRHFQVKEYIAPERFESLRSQVLKIGFRHLESGPYIRSSYHASKYV